MNEKTIKKLIKLVEESDIDVLEVSSWGRKVRITRRMEGSVSGNGHNPAVNISSATRQAAPTVPVVQQDAADGGVAPAVSTVEDNYVPIKAPMVGTFYAAPAPDAKPYVDQGDRIDKGQVVCIVEAMKLMNEIESEVGGRIAKICVNNAEPVEFGQTLFLIDPSG